MIHQAPPTIDLDDPPLCVPDDLLLAAEYRRVIHASVERIWENVFDWEHLPVLHDTYFNNVELLSQQADGWAVKLTRQPGDPSRIQILELVADRPHARYCVRTLEGGGVGTHIWTVLKTLAPDETAIRVRYFLPETRDDRLAVLGDKYRSSCQQLWDEDERMMIRRTALLARRAIALPLIDESPAPLALGPVDEVRARLPLIVDFGGREFRIVELDGDLIAHATTCPHWLGPLDAATIVDGAVRCPWHGYAFDVRSGACIGGNAGDRRLRLERAPKLVVDATTCQATLVAGDED